MCHRHHGHHYNSRYQYRHALIIAPIVVIIAPVVVVILTDKSALMGYWATKEETSTLPKRNSNNVVVSFAL